MTVAVPRDLLALRQAFAGACEALLGQGWVRVWGHDRGDSSGLLAIVPPMLQALMRRCRVGGEVRFGRKITGDPPCVLAKMPPALHALMLALQGRKPICNILCQGL